MIEKIELYKGLVTLIISILFAIGIIWFLIITINEINDIGLKEIFNQIWYGKGGEL